VEGGGVTWGAWFVGPEEALWRRLIALPHCLIALAWGRLTRYEVVEMFR